MSQDDNFNQGKEYALRQLEYSNKSEKEMREKLYLKDYEEAVVDKVIDFLKEYTFIDDNKYAKDYIKKKLPSQGQNKIKYSLIGKGISKEIIEKLLQEIDSSDEDTIAFTMAERKYLSLIRTEQDKKKLYKKLGDFLIRKGYSFEVTKKVLSRLLQVDL
jgi:regulatory protein